MSESAVTTPDDALTPYQRERFRRAREAGLTKVEALRFAQGQVPLRTLRKLRRDRCPPAKIAQIVC